MDDESSVEEDELSNISAKKYIKIYFINLSV